MIKNPDLINLMGVFAKFERGIERAIKSFRFNNTFL